MQQIVDVTPCAIEMYGSNVVLLGSSAGAPMAGSAMAQVLESNSRVGQDGVLMILMQNNAMVRVELLLHTSQLDILLAPLGFGRHLLGTYCRYVELSRLR